MPTGIFMVKFASAVAVMVGAVQQRKWTRPRVMTTESGGVQRRLFFFSHKAATPFPNRLSGTGLVFEVATQQILARRMEKLNGETMERPRFKR